jgi:hypothetical protein
MNFTEREIADLISALDWSAMTVPNSTAYGQRLMDLKARFKSEILDTRPTALRT